MRSLLLIAAFAASLVRCATAQSGGRFEMASSTISSGGGVSTGGDFALSGSIGQPDAGLLGGGTFSLSGGFWAVSVLPGPNTLTLSLQRTPGLNAILTWPDDGTVWQLQSSTDLVSWTVVNSPAQLIGNLWSVSLTTNPVQHFFRIMPLP